MRANYHNHTFRCGHAIGKEEEYLKRAIDAGLEIFGFSDHAPYLFPGDYVSPSRMRIEEIDSYFDTILGLREKYKGQIKIPIGFEMEYYPKLFDRALEIYSRYPLDYLILGEHMIGNEGISAINAFAPTDSIMTLRSFVDYCINALRTEKFSYVCHPDNINFTGEDGIYVDEMSRLIEECNRLCVPLEINLLGMRSGRHYPKALFWETAGKLGATAVLGFDSHDPRHVAVESEIETGIAFAEKHGLKLLDEIELKKPFI
jgi:histidinol-phosphatase (PHP family)